MKLQRFDEAETLPKKFIAIFGDGSGCEIFREIGPGKYILVGRMGGFGKDWLEESGYQWFIPLPDDFKVWGER